MVEADGTLEVFVYASLTLQNDDDNLSWPNDPPPPNNSIVDGTLVLDGNQQTAQGGELRFVNASQVVSGDGTIMGNKNSKINIADSLTFTSQLDNPGHGVRGGWMYIQGPQDYEHTGTFRNEGIAAAVVGAFENGLLLDFDLNLQDTENATWLLADAGTTMKFHRSATGLLGNFAGHCNSDFFIFASAASVEIRTCGTFARSGCRVSFFAGGQTTAQFRFRTYSEGSPPSGCGTYTPNYISLSACSVSNMYEVPTDLTACACD